VDPVSGVRILTPESLSQGPPGNVEDDLFGRVRRSAMRCFIVVKERSDAEKWDWVLAGPGLHAAGSLGARGTEDAIIAAVGAA
jgi:hypothetical protein